MLTNFQIEELAPKMNIPLEGVYFKDDISYDNLESDKSYVINLMDEHDEDGNPNSGSHWTCLHIGKVDNTVVPFYFDSYGVAPPETIKSIVNKKFGKKINYCKKNVQSIMSDCCGYFVLAYLHFINAFYNRTKNIFTDSALFLDLFEDLDSSADWLKNEYILKMFFQERGNPNLAKLGREFKSNSITKNDDTISVPIEDVKLRN